MSELLAVPLISKNGVRGKVLTSSRLLDERREKSVVFESGREATVASEHLHLKTDGTYFLDLTVDPREPESTRAVPPQQASPNKPGDLIIPVIQERANVTKRVVETGRVRVSKIVTEEPFCVDEPLIRDEYEIKRVPIGKVVTETFPSRVEGDVTIVPVYEEETIVVKRLVLREEIHLVKKQRVTHHRGTITLRKEKVEVERIPSRNVHHV